MFQYLRVISLITTMMVFLSACASDPKSDGSAAAFKLWGDCVMFAVSQLDDGKSDPVSVAYGISPRCAVQYNKYSEIMVGQMWTDKGQDYAREQQKGLEIRVITSAILTYRSADAQGKQRLVEMSKPRSQ